MFKRLGGLVGLGILTLGFLGCGDEMPKADVKDAAPDGRPAGFSDMMKGMDGQMKKAGSNPKALAK